MSGHTPGPWSVISASWSDEGNVCFEIEGISLITKADALVIEAVPELLEFAQWIASRSHDDSQECIKARAVIAKATGDTP